MSETFRISCVIQPQGDPLGLEIWFNDQKLFDQEKIDNAVDFESECADHEDDTCFLKFVLKNKTSEHTKLDDNNRIIVDSIISISNICFDEVNIDQVVYDKAQYQHNFNNTSAKTIEKFYGDMGCNGTVELAVTTPIYLWLLENM
jgi:hypothetical protein